MKCIKMMLYGEPGVGKSVFACHAPRPFFITTDGNYEWLEDFGAKPEAHKQVFSWEEAKNAFAQPYDNYDTIVVDLVEDLFKWCEQEYCTRSKLEHVSDVGYGKGYDITRNEFFLEISKLLSKPKHIILISHGITFETKDRRGVTHVKHAPSSRIPDKVMDMIEGRLRYCLRCYQKAEEKDNGELVKTRWLSLVPKENEFGIIRGVNENDIPHDIPLDWNEFAKAIKLNNEPQETIKETTQVIKDVKSEAVEEVKKTSEQPQPVGVTEANPMPFDEPTAVQETTKEPQINNNVAEQPKPEQSTQPQPQPSNADKLAAIKAKLAAMQNKN